MTKATGLKVISERLKKNILWRITLDYDTAWKLLV